jgi:hypothetical protein
MLAGRYLTFPNRAAQTELKKPKQKRQHSAALQGMEPKPSKKVGCKAKVIVRVLRNQPSEAEIELKGSHNHDMDRTQRRLLPSIRKYATTTMPVLFVLIRPRTAGSWICLTWACRHRRSSRWQTAARRSFRTVCFLDDFPSGRLRQRFPTQRWRGGRRRSSRQAKRTRAIIRPKIRSTTTHPSWRTPKGKAATTEGAPGRDWIRSRSLATALIGSNKPVRKPALRFTAAAR